MVARQTEEDDDGLQCGQSDSDSTYETLVSGSVSSSCGLEHEGPDSVEGSRRPAAFLHSCCLLPARGRARVPAARFHAAYVGREFIGILCLRVLPTTAAATT